MRGALLAAVVLAGIAAVPAASAQAYEPPAPIMPPPASVPTLAADTPALTPGPADPKDGDVYTGDLVWRQIEFYPKARLAEVRTTLDTIRYGDRYAGGWVHITSRSIVTGPGFPSAAAIARTVNGTLGPAAIFTGENGTPLGRLANGFTIRLDPHTALYGISGADGVTMLGATLSYKADHAALTRAFQRLNQAYGLILVYWVPGAILASPADKDEGYNLDIPPGP